jgi:Rrf2 family protein
MLRLSKRSDYALIAMRHLAMGDGVSAATPRSSVSARELAERFDIPVELLAKVLQKLARAGLLLSHQGIRGGYVLARPAQQISVADIIVAIDGPLTVTACSDQDQTCDQYSKCNVRDPLWRLKDRIVSALAGCTLAELAVDPPADAQPVVLMARRPQGAGSRAPGAESRS